MKHKRNSKPRVPFVSRHNRGLFDIEPDLPHVRSTDDLHTAVSVLISLGVFGIVAVVLEHRLHVNADIMFGITSATAAPSLSSWLRTFL